jgi:hypothetical protein
MSPQRVKMLNRELCEAGIYVMRDHPQGKRYGRRDAQGRIITTRREPLCPNYPTPKPSPLPRFAPPASGASP